MLCIQAKNFLHEQWLRFVWLITSETLFCLQLSVLAYSEN